MPTQLQLRRGNTAQTATFTGAVAEITVDTDKKTVVVHDGTTAGGFALALESAQLDQFAFTKANLAFDRANSAFAQANAAYSTANTKFNSAGGTISGNVIVTGNVTPTTDNIYSLGSSSNRWKDLFVGPGSINIDGIVIGNNGGQIVISGASDFVFQSTTGAPSVSSSASANIALNAFNQANLAFNQANTSYGSFAQANLAYTQANSGVGIAVSAFAQANLAFTAANNAVSTGQANVGAGLITVTSAYQVNVGAGLIGVTSAYGANVGAARIADVASGQANVGASVITLNNNIGNAFNQANLAFTAANNAVDTWVRNQANAAYNAANTAVTTGQANVGAGLISVTSAYQANVGAGLISTKSAYEANVGVAIASGQANVGNAITTVTSAYQANVGASIITTTNAYQANAGAGLITEVAARQANVGASVITLSNNITNVFNQANLAFTAANNAVDTWVRNQANSAYDRANSSFAQANLAYTTANAALPKTGGTITGDLTVSGNLFISGNTTTLNVTSLSVSDTLIHLGNENESDSLDIGFIGHYANTPNNHTGLIRKFTDGRYYLFDNLLTNVEPTNIVDIANTRVATLSANLITNVITLRGLDPLDYSNTIYSNAQANTGAAVISLTSAYQANTGAAALAGQANVGAGLISVTSAYQANVGAARIDANTANTTLAASIASGRLADNANVGASIITVTNAYQANVGAGRIADVASGQANVGAGLIAVTSAYQANVGSARIDANTANTTLAASIVSGRQADNANLGATIITVTSAYQSNVGAGLITVTSAYQSNVGSAIAQGQANTGAAVISLTSAYQANAGAGDITVTNNYQANVGAVNIAKVAKAGDVMTGALSTSGALIGASLTSNTIATINTNAVYESTAVTTAAATQFTLDSFSTTAYRSAKYLVQISSGSSYELLEMTLIHDGTTVYLSQYGNIKTGATLGVFDATISTGTLSLLATPNNAVTTFKTAITLIPA